MNKKYKLTNKSILYKDKRLYRIKSLKDFGDVKKVDLGGWVGLEYNLSQEGNCWVYDEGKVYEYAKIDGNAKVMNKAEIYGYVYINYDVVVRDHAKLYGNIIVKGPIEFSGYAKLYEM